ncbi:hypothetical protein [Bacillus sp. Marseille-P3661]|uniref:hypothetical protein n=1 Tax=Bacillus sp. Marseille-P3661 TaxID=1936234 RepID=UPI0015E16C42|nr:hypothetical protein [Bacillus sp. Marseille-P3661]
MNELKKRSPNLPLANPGYSNGHRKLRRNNELLLRRLDQIQSGPFGIWSWFNRKCLNEK